MALLLVWLSLVDLAHKEINQETRIVPTYSLSPMQMLLATCCSVVSTCLEHALVSRWLYTCSTIHHSPQIRRQLSRIDKIRVEVILYTAKSFFVTTFS